MISLLHIVQVLNNRFGKKKRCHLLVQKFPRQAIGNVFSSSSVISSSGVEKPSSVQEDER